MLLRLTGHIFKGILLLHILSLSFLFGCVWACVSETQREISAWDNSVTIWSPWLVNHHVVQCQLPWKLLHLPKFSLSLRSSLRKHSSAHGLKLILTSDTCSLHCNQKRADAKETQRGKEKGSWKRGECKEKIFNQIKENIKSVKASCKNIHPQRRRQNKETKENANKGITTEGRSDRGPGKMFFLKQSGDRKWLAILQ